MLLKGALHHFSAGVSAGVVTSCERFTPNVRESKPSCARLNTTVVILNR